MTTMTIPVEELDDLTAGSDTDSWILASDTQTGTWKWGTDRRLVVRHIPTGEFYDVFYRTYHGDGDYDTYHSDGEPVVMRHVRRVEVTAFEYQAVDGAA